MRLNRASILLLLGLLVAPAGISAQATPFQLRFANPGARSLGFGGAFAALADDATAAYANPAGLVQLVRPEISIEARITAFSINSAADGTPDVSGVGFSSFVYPRKRWSVAIYDTQLVELGNPFTGGVGFQISGSVNVRNQGLSGAYNLTENLSLGLGISTFDGAFDTTTQIFAVSSPVASQILATSTAESSDLSLSAGFLWHFSKRWNFGGFFRQGPTFGISALVTDLSETVLSSRPNVSLALSDTVGLGVVYQSRNGAVTASFEWDHQRSASALGDGDELHLGFEFAVIKTSPILALRLGGWLDPARSARGPGDDPFLRALFPDRDDEFHFAAGVGLAFKKLKVDIGADVSDPVTPGSLAFVYSF